MNGLPAEQTSFSDDIALATADMTGFEAVEHDNGVTFSNHDDATPPPNSMTIRQDLEARSLAPGRAAPANQEELDHVMAAQDALRQEWEMTLNADDDMDWDAADTEDMDMLLALQVSAQEEADAARNESRPDGRPPGYFA